MLFRTTSDLGSGATRPTRSGSDRERENGFVILSLRLSRGVSIERGVTTQCLQPFLAPDRHLWDGLRDTAIRRNGAAARAEFAAPDHCSSRSLASLPLIPRDPVQDEVPKREVAPRPIGAQHVSAPPKRGGGGVREANLEPSDG